MFRVHRPVTFHRKFFTGLSLALLPALALASGSRVGFKDAFATARGNAFVATADNPSAVYYNPAGLARQDGAQFAGNVYTLAMSSDYSGAGGTASLKNDAISIPAFYASWHPTGAPWAYGFGVYAPFGLSTEWPASSPLRTFALKNTQTYLTYNFSGAWQFSPTFSAGAGVTYNRVSTDLRRALGVLSADDLFRFEGKGTTVGYNLGLLWQPRPEHSFGLSYSHQTSVTLNGTSSTIPLVSSEPASAEFTFPEVVIDGWSWRPTPLWNVEADIDWTHWSRFGTVTVNKPSGAQPLVFNWKSGYFYELGATRYLADGWNVSAGRSAWCSQNRNYSGVSAHCG